MRNTFAAITGIIGCILTSVPATAQTTPYYQGKQVKILVGFSAGGGTDLFGRVMADGLARHIAGKPTVVVQNMPGAGSVVALNTYVSKVPRDGQTVLVGTGQMFMRILLGLDGARAKVSDFEPIVGNPMGRVTYASPAAGIKTPKDILKPAEPLILGVPEVIATIDAVMGLKVIDAKFRAVMGYPGKSDTRLALQRGEVNLDGQATPVYETSVKQLVAEGKAVPLFAQGLMDGDALVRDPALPDMPTVAEVYREIYGKEPSGSAWEAYKATVRAVGNGGKMLVIHSDTPPEARAELLRAVEAMKTDKDFLKSAAAVLEGYELNSGKQLQDNVAAIGRMSQDDIKWLQDLLSSDFKMKFH